MKTNFKTLIVVKADVSSTGRMRTFWRVLRTDEKGEYVIERAAKIRVVPRDSISRYAVEWEYGRA